MSDEKEKVDFLIGADPELVFLNPSGQLEPAYNYLRNADHPDPLGCDGHAAIAEVRPGPGTPLQLVDNIEKILRDYRNKLPAEIRWCAGSFVGQKPIGGHIHFDMEFQEHFGLALDSILTQFCAPMEDPIQAYPRRNGGKYGMFFAFQPDAIRKPVDKRGKRRFEYRTLPSFILGKSISIGIYALAKAIIWEEVNEGRYRYKRIPKTVYRDSIVIDQSVRRAYEKADWTFFQNRIAGDDKRGIWGIISRYEYWKTEEGKPLWRYVVALKNIALSDKHWDNGRDVLQRWKITGEELRNFVNPTYGVLPEIENDLTEERVWPTIVRTAPIIAERQAIRANPIVAAPPRRTRQMAFTNPFAMPLTGTADPQMFAANTAAEILWPNLGMDQHGTIVIRTVNAPNEPEPIEEPQP